MTVDTISDGIGINTTVSLVYICLSQFCQPPVPAGTDLPAGRAALFPSSQGQPLERLEVLANSVGA